MRVLLLFVPGLRVDSAGVHVSAVLSYRPAASVSVSRLQLSLHLDLCCRLQLRCTSTHLPVQFVFCCFLCSHVSLSLLGDAQCKLTCRSREQDFMVSRGSQFIDGTRCEAAHTVPPGSISACLGGKCQVMPDTKCKLSLLLIYYTALF